VISNENIVTGTVSDTIHNPWLWSWTITVTWPNRFRFHINFETWQLNVVAGDWWWRIHSRIDFINIIPNRSWVDHFWQNKLFKTQTPDTRHNCLWLSSHPVLHILYSFGGMSSVYFTWQFSLRNDGHHYTASRHENSCPPCLGCGNPTPCLRYGKVKSEVKIAW